MSFVIAARSPLVRFDRLRLHVSRWRSTSVGVSRERRLLRANGFVRWIGSRHRTTSLGPRFLRCLIRRRPLAAIVNLFMPLEQVWPRERLVTHPTGPWTFTRMRLGVPDEVLDSTECGSTMTGKRGGVHLRGHGGRGESRGSCRAWGIEKSRAARPQRSELAGRQSQNMTGLISQLYGIPTVTLSMHPSQ